MNSTFKIDWGKLLASKTIRSMAILGASLIGMYVLKLSEADAAIQAAAWVDPLFQVLALIAGGAFVSTAHGRVYADGPLTKSVDQVRTETAAKMAKQEVKNAERASKTAAKLARIQSTHGKK